MPTSRPGNDSKRAAQQQHAARALVAKLLAKLNSRLTGSGRCVGDPRIQAGSAADRGRRTGDSAAFTVSRRQRIRSMQTGIKRASNYARKCGSALFRSWNKAQ